MKSSRDNCNCCNRTELSVCKNKAVKEMSEEIKETTKHFRKTNMITQEYINGYVAALDNLINVIENRKTELERYNKICPIPLEDRINGLEETLIMINNTKNNYKELIKKLNKGK